MAPLLTWCVLPVVDQAGLATFLGVFLTFGLGGNVLYYTASAWDRTAGECHASVGDRVLAVHRAALLRLLPPLASGGCFLVLLASLLRPLREMGLFAGVCAVCSCALCLAIFVPLLVLRERSLAPRLERSGLPGWLKAALEPQACAAVPWERAAAGCVQVAAVRGKWLLVGAAVAVFIMFCITVGVTAVSDGGAGLPEVFSPDHPRAARRAVEEVFAAVQPSVEQGPQETKFCEPHVDSECGLFWCNTLSSDLGRPKDTTGAECTCHREGDGACSRVTVRTRLSGSDAALQGEDDLKLFVEDVVNSTLGLSAAEWADAPDAWPQRTLALESTGCSGRSPWSRSWSCLPCAPAPARTSARCASRATAARARAISPPTRQRGRASASATTSWRAPAACRRRAQGPPRRIRGALARGRRAQRPGGRGPPAAAARRHGALRGERGLRHSGPRDQ
ncbi:unnamed protein product [Prorocentrum cordatum]|uniref:SSD domain-containing protein n=1 Tax=Prorocentrum cordatum TaxID=2364126 RepID=A0ABN9TGB6_9DINO|nr:unnamed protein product [Polarella glacialis]